MDPLDSDEERQELSIMVERLTSTDLSLAINEELVCRLRSLVTNIKWSPSDTAELFHALLKRFMSTSANERGTFTSWIVKLLYSIEMNNVTSTLRLENGKTVIQVVSDITMTEDLIELELCKTTEKNLDTILEEIYQNELNETNESILDDVKNIVLSVTKSLDSPDNVSQCTLHDLENNLEKVLFNLCVAVKMTKKYIPRLTQMVSWCLMALSKSGWLIQVGTGEGKSCIVAMFAAFRALRGEEVDIMSSSPVLAERDFDEWKSFYKHLNISVTYNTESSQVNHALNNCYMDQVVYGTSQQFAGDWLRHHFQRTYVRGKRKFRCAIVDEVDSLMLDKGCHVVYLSSDIPAMQHLNSLLALIWSTVSQYGKKVDQFSILRLVEERINGKLQFTPCEISHGTECVYVPGFLKDLVKANLKVWIENAYHAQTMTPGHEYIIDGHAIVPVDYTCTGVVENNMKWCDGLQQFLEFKHQDQVKLTDMTVTTNYMSNVGLLQMYGDQIYGISGTLGQRSEIETLQKLYKGIKTCQIPSFKRRKLFEVEGVILDNEEEWIERICDVVLAQIRPTTYRAERAVLVICETINRAEALHRYLADQVKEKKLYINNNEDNSAIFKKKLEAGNVIIATNLAGRGTDLGVSDEVNKSGGLFVVQTFLPQNARVEQQAFGRTARQGLPGSAQLIVCSSHLKEDLQLIIALDQIQSKLENVLDCMQLYEKFFISEIRLYRESQKDLNYTLISLALSHILTKSDSGIKMAKMARDVNVAKGLSNYLEISIPKLKRKQELFNQYLAILDNLYKGKPLDSHVSSLNETWGMWLLMRLDERESIEDMKSRLDTDMKMAMQNLTLGESPSSNLHHYTNYANDLCVKGNHAEGINMYTKAIHLDQCWAAFALYNRAFLYLAQKEIKREYINQAIEDLTNALKSIQFYQTQIKLTHLFTKTVENPLGDSDTRFDKHMRTKFHVLELFKENIKQAIKNLEYARATGRNVMVHKKPVHLIAPLELMTASIPDALMGISLIKVLVPSSQKMLKLQKLINQPSFDYFIEFNNLASLGLTSVFSVDTIFCIAGFLSNLFNSKH